MFILQVDPNYQKMLDRIYGGSGSAPPAGGGPAGGPTGGPTGVPAGGTREVATPQQNQDSFGNALVGTGIRAGVTAGSMAYAGQVLTNTFTGSQLIVPPTSTIIQNSMRFTSTFPRTVNGITTSCRYLGTVPYLGGAARLAGRGLPILGALIAVGSVGTDLYRLGSMEKQEGETDAEFRERYGTQRTDTLINAGCTVGGAAIGAAIGAGLGCGILSVPGALLGAAIGAGIGNLIGTSLQSGGLLRSVASGIGTVFRGLGRALFG